MMIWQRRTLVIALALLVVGSVSGVDALAAEPTRIGWWHVTHLDDPAAGLFEVVGPSGVPDDGLYLEAGPAGAVAVAALHFEVTPAGSAVLTLHSADKEFSAATPVMACPIISEWKAAQGGAWSERPRFECDATAGGTPGRATENGDSMTWKFGAGFETPLSGYQIALVPQGPLPFDITVAQPNNDALTTAQTTRAKTPTARTPVDSPPLPRSPELTQRRSSRSTTAPADSTSPTGDPSPVPNVSEAPREHALRSITVTPVPWGWRNAWLWMLAFPGLLFWHLAGRNGAPPIDVQSRRRAVLARPPEPRP